VSPASVIVSSRHSRATRTSSHSTLGYRSPAEFENDHHGKLSKVA
jgi:hypothetical protein